MWVRSLLHCLENLRKKVSEQTSQELAHAYRVKLKSAGVRELSDRKPIKS